MADMEKRHFEAIAATLKDIKPPDARLPLTHVQARRIGAREQWETTVRRMAATLATFNPNFRASQFYRACGLES